MNDDTRCRGRRFPGLLMLVGLFGITGCTPPANIEYLRASGPDHICPGEPVEVSYLVVNVDDFALSRNGVTWRLFGRGENPSISRASALQDTLTDNPEVDTTYAVRIQGPGLASPMSGSVTRDVIVGTEVKRISLRLVGCRGPVLPLRSGGGAVDG